MPGRYQPAETIKSVIEKIDTREWILPSIQRRFVWDTDRIENLFDSIMQGYPIGTLMVWKVTSKETIKKIGFYNFEKNSAYMILNSEIYGATHREIVLASFVAYSTGLDEINPQEWAKYKGLVTDEDIDVVKKMGVMLKIAYCLDRSNSSLVKGFSCDILGDSVIMKTEIEGDASIELNAASEVAFEFRKVFKKNLEIL